MIRTAPLSTPAVARRSFVGGTGALILGLGVGGAARGQAHKLVSTIFGGRFEDEYRKAIVAPFEQKYGVQVTLKYGSAPEWLTSALLNRKSPEIDLLWMAYPQSVQAIVEDLCMELTVEDIPNLAQVEPVWYEGFKRKGVGLDYASFGIAYRTDLVRTTPTSWADLWNPEYRGKIALPDITASGGYETLVLAATAHGGSVANIEPGFEALRKLRPGVRKFYRSNPEAQQMLERGEVTVCPWFDGRTWGLVDAGVKADWVAPKEGAAAGMVSYHIPMATKDPELCKRFIDFAISKEAQEGFCNAMQYGPVNRTAVLTGLAKQRVPSLSQLKVIDWFAMVPNLGTWQERWNREIVG
jgi:putative spermidine/putrescine transport system substrate-binding protein